MQSVSIEDFFELVDTFKDVGGGETILLGTDYCKLLPSSGAPGALANGG
jgi:hypothetical protein